MFIYNVTSKVDWSIHDAWLQWMQQVHLPEMIKTDCFTHTQLVRLLDTDEKEGPTYAAQYYADSKPDYNRYIEIHSAGMRQKTFDRFGDKVVSFRSLMQIVEN